MWEIEGRYRGDGYGEREEIERKMREAYECGYEDAKREMRDGYGRASHGRLHARRLRRAWRRIRQRRIWRTKRCPGNRTLLQIPPVKRIRRGEKSPLFNSETYGQRKIGRKGTPCRQIFAHTSKKRMVLFEENVNLPSAA